jgi:hypothetical protein
MGWFGIGANESSGTSATTSNMYTNSNSNSNIDSSGSSITNPVLSDTWTQALKGLQGIVGPNGTTAGQDQATNYTQGQLSPNSPVNSQAGVTNAALSGNNASLQNVADYFGAQGGRDSYTLGALAAKAAAGVPGYESYAAPTPVTAQQVTATQGSKYLNDYLNPYTNDVVNAALADYDTGTDRTQNAMRAARDAGSAFGDRAAIADAVYQGEANRGRAATSANLRGTAFNTAAGLGMQDANRFLQADTTNAANALNAQEFNNNLLNNRQQFDVNAAYQGDQSRDQAMLNQANVLKQQAGLSQQQLDNVVTANGIDTNAAQSLFQAGQIGFQQLQAILQAVQATNGQQTTTSGSQSTTGSQSSKSSGTSFTTDDKSGFSF